MKRVHLKGTRVAEDGMETGSGELSMLLLLSSTCTFFISSYAITVISSTYRPIKLHMCLPCATPSVHSFLINLEET